MGKEIKPILKVDVARTLDKMGLDDFTNFPLAKSTIEAVRIAVYRRGSIFSVARTRKHIHVKKIR